jgi:hypothetical protein
MSKQMRKEDLSIGFEIVGRPSLGIQERMDGVHAEVDWPDDYKLFNQQYWNPVHELSLLGPD